jgi:hypothetical protein
MRIDLIGIFILYLSKPPIIFQTFIKLKKKNLILIYKMPKKLSQEEFIERCKKKHNNYYSYDKTVYTGMSNDDYIIVTCPIHGDFKQLAAGHIRGKGCKDCAGTITKTTEQFIIDARKVHGDEYDYSKSKYINAMTYIEIICRKHGSFWQKPNTHLIGKGCFECYGSKMLTQEEFINRCIEKHNGFYIYDKTIYTGCNYTITITCPVHGDFQQNLNTTLEGVIKFVSMTEAEYKALETKSPSTIYHLTDVSMWAIGDQEIVTSNMPA